MRPSCRRRARSRPSRRARTRTAGGVCILPFGVLEKHGDHLPLGTDALTAHAIAVRAAEQEPALVFPLFYFGMNTHAKCEPGAIAIRFDLLLQLLESVCDEISRNGFDKIPAPSDQAAMREAIHRERRVEFNCEYAIRFDDIRRWKQIDILRGDYYGMNKFGTEKSCDKNNENAYFKRRVEITRAFSEKNYWFPIHQNQLDKNPNLRQLPKW